MTWKSTGPLTYQGAAGAKPVDKEQEVQHLVVHPLGDAYDISTSGKACVVHPTQYEHLTANLNGMPAFLQLAGGSDYLCPLAADARVSPGTIQLDAVARHNLHVALHASYDFTAWVGPGTMEQLDLVEISLEVRLLGRSAAAASAARSTHLLNGRHSSQGATDEPMEQGLEGPTEDEHACDAFGTSAQSEGQEAVVDAQELHRLLLQTHTGNMLCINQLVCVTDVQATYVLRVVATHSLDADARAEALVYHCYRGRLVPDSVVHISRDTSASTEGLQLMNESVSQPVDDTTKMPNIIEVETNDDEMFPVKKALLRPCLALTAFVRSPDRCRCSVNIDTLTFDRVLIFLESLALHTDTPQYAAHLIDALLQASQELQCQSLVTYCQEKLGAMEERVCIRGWNEVLHANATGCLWLVLDGMVLDVTTWIEQHPGGSTIIPEQALDKDCSRFFEMYHSSRESFLYLKECYLGEIRESELHLVPVPAEASNDFLQQLRHFTSWRISNDDIRVFKSF